MNTLKRNQSIALPMSHSLHAARRSAWNYSNQATARSFARAKSRREQILACLAFLMLIVAWDATLRLDERVAPPRMRMSHAVELMGEQQTLTSLE